MKYDPSRQYRCTIIRGKSQSEMEDMLPFYAQMVHMNCPCTREEFNCRCNKAVSKLLFGSNEFGQLPSKNQKTVRNHVSEIAGKLLGLYYTDTDGIVHETDACSLLIEKGDFPLFFKNICANLQFPNGSQKIQTVRERIANGIELKPLCYVVALLDYARCKSDKLLTKQEIGFYVLNSLDVLRGKVAIQTVYAQIMTDRADKVKHGKLQGSHDWQHIKEQFNLLDLSNVTISDDQYIWLNTEEKVAIELFKEKCDSEMFAVDDFDLSIKEGCESMFAEWGKYYGRIDRRFENSMYRHKPSGSSADVRENGSVGLTTSEIGEQGELLVYQIECKRVKQFKERLVNKVLLLGNTKGLGYDISSIEADENISRPEFARYIEVKTTRRSTEPSFTDALWNDSLNLTAKEWIAAEQYGEYYNIYRVYFTKTKTIVVRIQNPFGLAQAGKIEVFPTIFQMNFNGEVIQKRYEQNL